MTGICSSKKLAIFSIAAILIIGCLTIAAYNAENNAIRDAVRAGMKSTVGAMATQVNASEIEGLQPGDETGARYLAVAQKLRTLRSMDDHILNAYILEVNPDQTITFVVDDLYPLDPQGSAKIGEISTAPRQDVINALSGPTASQEPYTTKYGSFMTAYAPIDDSLNGSYGNTTAVLAIDLTAADYTKYTTQGGLVLATGLVSMAIAVGAIGFFGMKLRKLEESGKKP
ncbi:MAG TPA: hypothetical protein VLY83_01635 [Methanoregula sp.]|nr:hypothetical protein [Methanoregula sp.]